MLDTALIFIEELLENERYRHFTLSKPMKVYLNAIETHYEEAVSKAHSTQPLINLGVFINPDGHNAIVGVGNFS